MASRKNNDQEFLFESHNLGLENIDAVNGIIRGVSVITSGVTARGHNLQVDMKCLEQMCELGQKMGKVPVKTNHRTGLDAVNGYLTNFAIKDNKLKADWHLLKSHKEFQHLIEMSEVMASSFGLSAAFLGRSVDGKNREIFDEEISPGKNVQYVQDNGKKVVLGLSDKRFARCSELVSVDAVAMAAANPDGLFESKVDNRKINNHQSMSDTNKTTEEQLADLTKLFAAQAVQAETQSEAINQLSATLNQLIEFATSEDEEDEDEGDDEEEEDEPKHKKGKEKGKDGENEYAATIEGAMQYLEAKVQTQLQNEQDAQLSHAFEVIEEKVVALTEFNATLQAENEALRTAYNKANGQSAIPGRESAVRLFSANAECDEWEAKVHEFEAAGAKKTEAISKAIAFDDGTLYLKHLERAGAVRK
jgi:hypothetical protein